MVETIVGIECYNCMQDYYFTLYHGTTSRYGTMYMYMYIHNVITTYVHNSRDTRECFQQTRLGLAIYRKFGNFRCEKIFVVDGGYKN